MPWIAAGLPHTLEEAAFLSGAALAQMQIALASRDAPLALVRERLALRAAELCVTIDGRSERAADLRDAVHLLRSGDLPGPAGETYLAWRRAVARRLSAKSLERALPQIAPQIAPETLAGWRAGGPGVPVQRAADVLFKVCESEPRSALPALILADAALARALGWDHILPLLGIAMTRRDLSKDPEDLRMACHRAVASAAVEALGVLTDVTRRAAHLRQVAPKLRAKQAGAAVEMFLTRDAVAPAALPLPDRAARRLCDRLVGLDAIRELTGRDTFRLYGV